MHHFKSATLSGMTQLSQTVLQLGESLKQDVDRLRAMLSIDAAWRDRIESDIRSLQAAAKSADVPPTPVADNMPDRTAGSFVQDARRLAIQWADAAAIEDADRCLQWDAMTVHQRQRMIATAIRVLKQVSE